MVNLATMLRLSTVGSPGHGAGLAAGATARWEWRIFERCPASLIERVAPRGGAAHPSRETYLLSSASRHNVKVRSGRLDVKLLEAVGPAGIQRWRPVCQSAFPIARGAFDVLWRAWGVQPTALDRSSYTLDQLLGEVVARDPRLSAVRVGKVRRRFTLAGCSAECAALTVAGLHWMSLAVEDERARDLLIAIGSLGDWPLPADYPTMLKHLADPASLTTHE